MKIGLVCPYNMARGGAVQEIVRDVSAGLIARGHEAKIITPGTRKDGEKYSEESVIFLGSGADIRTPMHTTASISVSVDPDEIDSMLAREQFDILHYHEPWIPVLSRQILSRSQSVNVATFHSKIPETIMSRTVAKVVTPYTKSVLKYLHGLTAVSDAAAEYVTSLTDEPITIIPNGIDLKRFQQKPHTTKLAGSKELKTIFYLGRLERRKGLKYLLQAYELLVREQNDVQLLIAGDGPDREKMEAFVMTLGLPNVTFLGFISDETKIELMRSADLFCSPAIYGESFGLVLLEAMACGTVTVAGNNSGYESVMQGLGKLSLVDPHDTAEFARRLSIMLNEDAVRLDWQKWSKDYVKQFDYPAIIDQYVDMYEYLLQHHSHHVQAIE